MKCRFLLPLTALFIAVAVIGTAWQFRRTTESAVISPETLPVAKTPVPAAAPPGPVPLGLRAEAAQPVDEEFTPGHFPGVSVRHEPGTHRPTPPAGTPRSEPVEQEVVLPDGRRLKAVTLDETWRVPVTAEEKR